jgi:hypothetical protein
MASTVTTQSASSSAQQRGQCGDFVAVVGHLELPQHQPIADGPDIDQMHRPASARATAPQRLAVERDQLAGDDRAQALRPGDETVHELRRINPPEHAIERVVRGDPVGQRQPGPKPVGLTASELSHFGEAFRAAEIGADADHQNVE